MSGFISFEFILFVRCASDFRVIVERSFVSYSLRLRLPAPRAFIENNHKVLKTKNPRLPILIREATGIQPQLWARFDYFFFTLVMLDTDYFGCYCLWTALVLLPGCGVLYLLKIMRKADMNRKNVVESILGVRDILISVHNPFAVSIFLMLKMVLLFESEENIYLVMEYLNGGDIFTMLTNLGCSDEDMVLALEYLHSLNVIEAYSKEVKVDRFWSETILIATCIIFLSKLVWTFPSTPGPLVFAKQALIRLQNFSSLSPEKRNRDTPAYVVLASTVLEMSEHDEKEGVVFEIAIAVSKWGQISNVGGIDVSGDCIQVLVDEVSRKGLNVARVVGLQNEFIKLAASTEVLGKAAAELKF
ncbi:hypothetical protein OROMI_017958 [Orobanche minor]